MKFCECCGNSLPPEAKYCPECGAKVTGSAEVDAGKKASYPDLTPFFSGRTANPLGIRTTDQPSAVLVTQQPAVPAFGGSDPLDDLNRDLEKQLAENLSYEKLAEKLERQLHNLEDRDGRAAEFIEKNLLPRSTERTGPFFRWLIGRYAGESEKAKE